MAIYHLEAKVISRGAARLHPEERACVAGGVSAEVRSDRMERQRYTLERC